MAGPKRTGYTIPLMVVAFLMIGGFIYWLNISTEAVRVAIAEEEEAAAAEPDAMTVSLEAFAAAPTDYADDVIRLEDVDVFGTVGPEAFLVLLPNDVVYLVHVEGGASVIQGSPVSVVGTVELMSDSVLDAWQARGGFTDPNQREEASYAASFIEALEVEVPTPDVPDPGTDPQPQNQPQN